MKCTLNLLLLFVFFATETIAQNKTPKATERNFKFDFGKGKVAKGFLQVSANTIYNAKTGYGIDLESKVIDNERTGKADLTDGFISSSTPYFFSVKVPEGNYHVKVTVGDDNGTSDIAIRAECRRMMVNHLQTKNTQHKTIELTVNVRDSTIHGNKNKIKLKKREYSYLHWDDKLTLEFNSNQPKINAIEISPEKEDVVSVFLAGNSTVVDSAHEPYSAWGQMFPSFFQPGKVSIVNLAESGETLSSFIGARRFAKLLSMMKRGDYAFVEFGHNDQKTKKVGAGPFTTYKKDLEFFIDEVHKKGGIPVLVTSVQRRRFDENSKIVETLGDYPAAVRLTAKEKNVALVDLNSMSKIMFEAMGEKESLKAFAHFPAGTYPGQIKEIADNTHFRPFGAYEVSKLILQGVRDAKLDLAKLIKESEPEFNPAKPDEYSSFYWPDSPSKDSTKPDGN